MKDDFSSMSQLVESHTTSIKQIEQQLGQLSASLNQRKNGSLPSYTIQNPKKDGYCIAIITRSAQILNDPTSAGTKHEQVSLVQKKEDSGAFTISCTIGSIEFLKALCDLGASINLMSLAIYKKLGLVVSKPTSMRLMVVDMPVKRPMAILCDVLIKVDMFIFLVDFVILD
ncbi:hypothetical protein R3W88_016294 [Solanum pinnatisectum]|uniref:Aspartic peptidase DDI1-type domain-containing protein n=1 Tax=Solanum pinnatisectum TaxID=50273 RepID=A0AAV9KWZ9_9SOLN|nr:hypothetical protein R3W88_016294 [Solanum pinnatisectum]